jgi:radical SAM protein with 4Fe4S-binding SPASM domain
MPNLSSSIEQLKNNYSINEPIFLSRFYQDNGDHWLYTTLKSLYKSEFQNNERLVFVQDCADVYDYRDLPGKAISQLQKYASQIDISNFFIIVLSGNKFINEELKKVRQLYSTDDCAIQSMFVDDLDYESVVNIRDTFCVLPWMHLYVGPDGNVLPCCIADQKFPMGNIQEQSVESILKSDRFVSLRENMLNHRRSKECNYCYIKEDAGLISARKKHNQRWSVSDPTAVIEKFNPVYLDIRLNNVCNLKCRMCSSYFSSSIAAEENKIFGIKNKKSALTYQQRTASLDEILGYAQYAEKIYFAGGEPLLCKEHYDILQQLIDCENVDLEIAYNTNFTTLQYQNFSVLELWKKFSNITIGASLDAEHQVAEYIRHGTVWTDIENNLSLLKTQCPHVKFNVTSTVGFLNIESLINLQKRWHTFDILDINNFSLTVMISPEHMITSALPTHHKQRLESQIVQHINWCQESGAISLATQWNNVLKYMWSQDNSHHLDEFRRLTNIMDQHRKESFVETFPEYTDLL